MQFLQMTIPTYANLGRKFILRKPPEIVHENEINNQPKQFLWLINHE